MIFLGIDAGSTTCKVVALNEKGEIVFKKYKYVEGDVLGTVMSLFEKNEEILRNTIRVGVTGSSRNLVAKHFGTSIINSEIISHSIAASYCYPGVGTIIEIGGQDAKYVVFEGNVLKEFSLNNSCGAGTGAFLENQCKKLGIGVADLDCYASKATKEIDLSGKCGVFIESAVLNYQRLGESKENIVYAICKTLATNYLNEFCKGKALKEPVCFQGGVAKSKTIRAMFSKILKQHIYVDEENCQYMGAIGSAMISKEQMDSPDFVYDNMYDAKEYVRKYSSCKGCSQNCLLMDYYINEKLLFEIGGKCGKYDLKE